ncbi:hypothetical protein NPIL_202171 [Nephila pilipes]|uniref:Uncharacterized protein n=1 Tax=Nephila pilipes TaxID=299642 RepID=A0A8X6TQZ6_NEPPI|nr:hypothetical protein NPIL_202171 [Nephila pilipes]
MFPLEKRNPIKSYEEKNFHKSEEEKRTTRVLHGVSDKNKSPAAENRNYIQHVHQESERERGLLYEHLSECCIKFAYKLRSYFQEHRQPSTPHQITACA